MLFEPELPPEEIAEAIFDFRMTRNRCLSSISGVHVNVVAGTMSLEETASIDKFPDKLVPFHTATSISLTSRPPVSGMVSSSIISL